MKKIVCLLFGFTLIYINSLAQEVKVIKYPELLNMMKQCNDDVVIYNFWATWCAPCIREMPHFETVDKKDGVTVRFISMDDVRKLEESVKPFLKKKDIKAEVYLLDETDFNAFIDKVDNRWSGAIPASVIFDCSEQEKLFYEKEFKNSELENLVQNLK